MRISSRTIKKIAVGVCVSKVKYNRLYGPRNANSADWRDIGGQRKYFRSKWEANYARYLQYLQEGRLIEKWEHEPKTFWFENIKRGVRSYLPDFKVYRQGLVYWVEVKGYMDAKSATKIKRFKKYYPEEDLRVVGESWFKENSKNLRLIIKGWE